MQFFFCVCFGVILVVYVFILFECFVSCGGEQKLLVDVMGLWVFILFKQKKMVIFFIFFMLLGVFLQIINGFVNLFFSSFKGVLEYVDMFGVNYVNVLIFLLQVLEILCILLILFVLKYFGIKCVMLIVMLVWVFCFGLFGLGNFGLGVWMFVLFMIVYGVVFDFFNIFGLLFVNNEIDLFICFSVQGLFVIMINGIGVMVGMLGVQVVVNCFVDMNSSVLQMEGWSMIWFVFVGYVLVVVVLFVVIFKYKYCFG